MRYQVTSRGTSACGSGSGDLQKGKTGQGYDTMRDTYQK